MPRQHGKIRTGRGKASADDILKADEQAIVRDPGAAHAHRKPPAAAVAAAFAPGAEAATSLSATTGVVRRDGRVGVLLAFVESGSPRSQSGLMGMPLAPSYPIGLGGRDMTGKRRRNADHGFYALLAKESREYHVRRLITQMQSFVRLIMRAESKREPYTIEDGGRLIKIWSLGHGYGR